MSQSTKKDYKVHNMVVSDPKLSLKAKGLMFYLLSKPAGWKGHQYDIIANCTDGSASVRTAVNELKAAGYLSTVAVRSKEGVFVDKYYQIKNKKMNANILLPSCRHIVSVSSICNIVYNKRSYMSPIGRGNQHRKSHKWI